MFRTIAEGFHPDKKEFMAWERDGKRDERQQGDRSIWTAPMSQDTQQSEAECILIYDGQCRLCVTAKEGLERLGIDRVNEPVRFVPYQSEEAARRLGSDYKPGRPGVAFLVNRDGGVQKGLEAFLPLLPGLRGGRVLLALIKVPLMRPLALLLYRLVARYRYRLFGRVRETRLG